MITLSQRLKFIFKFKHSIQKLLISLHSFSSSASFPPPGPDYAIEGRNFTLPPCHVTGYPAPVVIWRKASGQLPHERVKYNNSSLQLLNARKIDSDWYICSATNLLGIFQRKTLVMIVSFPRFTVKPPLSIFAPPGSTLTLNCSAAGDPQPVISWRKQGGHLPVGRNQQINGALVIRNITKKDAGHYICTATSAGVFNVETLTYVQAFPPKGQL